MNIGRFSRIIRIGNSEGVVIPANVLRDLKWDRGDVLFFALAEHDVLCLRKLTNEEIEAMKLKTLQF